jgi:thioredoxin reductase (NADPH)
MMEDLRKQAERFGTDIRLGIATACDFSENPLKVIIDNTIEIVADVIIIATGATAKYLGIPAEKTYAGMGVSACATCDGFFYRGKDVAVVGGVQPERGPYRQEAGKYI